MSPTTVLFFFPFLLSLSSTITSAFLFSQNPILKTPPLFSLIKDNYNIEPLCVGEEDCETILLAHQGSGESAYPTPEQGYFRMKSPHTANDANASDQIGLLPRGPRLSMRQKVTNLIERLDDLQTDLQRYALLHGILETDATLYFATILSNVPKILPLVYTPTVGAACINLSKIHTNQPKGIYLSKYDKGNIVNVMKNWPFNAKVKVICVTDGERILGLGDLGCNGMGIPVGKLALYTAIGGIEPEGTLPIHIDFGCNVAKVRDDEMYMGLRESRPAPDDVEGVAEYDAFMVEFFEAIAEIYGRDCLVQFEDFGNSNAFRFLEMFQDKQVRSEARSSKRSVQRATNFFFFFFF